jgi:hypothetical protein
MTDRLAQLIRESGFKSAYKVIPYVRSKSSDYTPRQIMSAMRNVKGLVVRDEYPRDTQRTVQHVYYRPVFGRVRGTYMIDLINKSAGKGSSLYPRYFSVAVNVNTKYCYAYRLTSKTSKNILDALKKWKTEAGAVNQITADREQGWVSKQVQDWANENGIVMKLTNSENHTTLSVVDRQIRTLRDMLNRPITGKETKASLRDFSNASITRLINNYNNSPHSALKSEDGKLMTPEFVQKNKDAEKRLIFKKLYEEANKEQDPEIHKWELKIGDNVRFILPKIAFQKRRYQISQQTVKITGRDGYNYVCSALDGTTHTFARWRLFPAHGNENEFETFKGFNKSESRIRVFH